MRSLCKKILLTAVLSALLSPSIHAADKAKDAAKETAKPAVKSEIVLRVNGKEFTDENLKVVINSLMPVMSYHSSISDERFKKIQKTAVEELINNQLIYEHAVKLNQTEVNRKEIEKRIKELRKNLPKGQTLEKILKNSNMTLDDLRDDFKKNEVVKNIISKKREEFRKKSADTVNEAFLKDYYQKNLGKFKEPEQIHLRSILIKADPAGGQRVWNESLKKAQDIVQKAKAEDFAKLAEKYSEDPNAKKGGDMGWAHQGSLFPEIEDAAAKMKDGEVSNPVMTIYGYHIVKLEGKKPSVQRKFEEINKEKLEKELEAKEQKKLWDDWIKDLRANARIEYLIDLK